MKIAQQLKEKNIAEYLIYMWQIEDLIRANDCDVDRIEENIVSRYQVSDEERRELTEWYANLASMMREEGVPNCTLPCWHHLNFLSIVRLISKHYPLL